MHQRTFDDFDEFASGYRSIHTDNVKISGADSFYFAEMKVRILKKHEQDIPLTLADIGCGDGTTETFIQKHFPGWIVKGFDVSEKSIAAARALSLPNAAFNTYDGRDIPVADESVDVVFMAGVLHHVHFELHRQLIAELYRILKKGGRLYVFEHNPLNPLTKHLVKTCVFDRDAKLLHYPYAMKRIREAGFKQPFKKFIIFFPRKGILSRLVFMEKYLAWLPLGGQYFIVAKK